MSAADRFFKKTQNPPWLTMTVAGATCTLSFYPRNMQRSGVHPLLPLLSTLGLELSSTTSRWKVSLGKAVLARLLEPPIVQARVEMVDESTCAVNFSRASKLACCRGRLADSNVQLEVGGDILTACEAILKLSCMF